MRLTLRTLLAYMDDILEPDDAQAIGKKIEESDFATGLLQRARDVMQRLRLAAPEVTDGEKGLDPNTVAEYLDNTLGSDRVTDFEKVCLESDVHLAEVAASHQILTLVLGEPAEVDPAGRERMYQLPNQLAKQTESQSAQPAASTAAQSSVAQSSPPTDAEPGARRNKPTVPAYLRETQPKRPRRRLPVLAVLLVTALLAVVLLAAFGQFEPGTPLARFLGIGAGDAGQVARAPEEDARAEEVEPPVGSTEPDPAAVDPAEADSPARTPTTPASAEPAAVDPATNDPSGMPAPAAEEGTIAAEQPATPAVQPVPPEPGKLPAGEAAKLRPETELTPAPPATVPPATGPPATGPPATGPPATGPAAAAPTEVAMRPESAKPAVEGPGSTPVPDEPPPAPPTPVGKLVSADRVLLQFDSGSAAWLRVPAEAGVLPQYELLALPTYRPIIALSGEVELTLVGGTQVALQPADQEGVVGLTVRYGRCVLHANGNQNSRLRLRVGNRTGMLTFRDTKSTVAIEVSRPLVPGTDPQAQPADETVDLYAISGRLLWAAEGSERPMEFDALARLRLDGQSPEPAAALRELPKWTVADEVGLLDRRASSTLNQELKADRPVSLTLRELIDHRQREVRWLAMRCLGHVGEFDPITSALNDPAQKLLWPDYIEHLQSALSRGPEVAVQIRRDLQKEYREDAPETFRLLCGFPKGDLATDQADLLLKGLDHKLLAVRVLSFWNLKQLTGLGLYYQPEATAAKRRQAVQKWTERLASGQIGGKSAAKNGAGKKSSSADAPNAPLPEGLK